MEITILPCEKLDEKHLSLLIIYNILIYIYNILYTIYIYIYIYNIIYIVILLRKDNQKE